MGEVASTCHQHTDCIQINKESVKNQVVTIHFFFFLSFFSSSMGLFVVVFLFCFVSFFLCSFFVCLSCYFLLLFFLYLFCTMGT